VAEPITVYRLAAAFDKEYPQELPERLATRAVRSLTEEERAEILVALLSSEIDVLRRTRAREIEHRAWQAIGHPKELPVERERRLRRKKEEREAREAKELEKAWLWAHDPEAYRRKYTLNGIIEAFEEEVRGSERLKVTAELLTVAFSLGDGRRVSWGEATLEDHRQRIEMLGKGIEGNVQTIRLHEYAATILRETGAACLNQSGAIAA
jgi:hypothetical protein